MATYACGCGYRPEQLQNRSNLDTIVVSMKRRCQEIGEIQIHTINVVSSIDTNCFVNIILLVCNHVEEEERWRGKCYIHTYTSLTRQQTQYLKDNTLHIRVMNTFVL